MGEPRANLISLSYTKYFLNQTVRKDGLGIYYIAFQIMNLLNDANSNI
jgi:hypothetical protein